MKNWYQSFTNVNNRYQILTIVKNWYQLITCEKLVLKVARVKNWYQILTHVSDKTVKNWTRAQNAADLGGYFINVKNTHVLYRAYFSQRRYWYEIGDVFVPIFHML